MLKTIICAFMITLLGCSEHENRATQWVKFHDGAATCYDGGHTVAFVPPTASFLEVDVATCVLSDDTVARCYAGVKFAPNCKTTGK